MSGRNYQKLSTQFASQEGNWGPGEGMEERLFILMPFCMFLILNCANLLLIHKSVKYVIKCRSEKEKAWAQRGSGHPLRS